MMLKTAKLATHGGPIAYLCGRVNASKLAFPPLPVAMTTNCRPDRVRYVMGVQEAGLFRLLDLQDRRHSATEEQFSTDRDIEDH